MRIGCLGLAPVLKIRVPFAHFLRVVLSLLICKEEMVSGFTLRASVWMT